jgi:phosphatidylglycerophosphate synthase
MMRMPLISEFKRSLKHPCAEEILDLAVFRPCGFLFAKVFYPFPITPNQISGLAMLSGIAAGFLFSGGDRGHFILAGMFYALSNVLDCCDGMIARLKKNGTKTGRIVDGVVDYVTGIAVFTGLGIGLTKAIIAGTVHLPCSAWILVAAAAASTALHAVLSDHYRNAFLVQGEGAPPAPEAEAEECRAELARLGRGKGRAFDRVLLGIYLRYILLQKGEAPGRTGRPPHRPGRISARTVVLWNLIGPSTHIFFLVLSACLFRPSIYFLFTIGVANLWMVGLLLLQRLARAPGAAENSPGHQT